MTQPPPLPPFKADDTEPGLGLIALKQTCRQLQQERDDARQERDSLRAGVSVSAPPPSRRAQNLLAGGKYAALIPLVVFAAGVAERKWPEFKDVIDAIMKAVGL